MLNHIKQDIQDEIEDKTSFSSFYTTYVCAIQDMDLENEILPLIKKQSTEFIKFKNKVQRSRKRTLRKMEIDI